MTVEAIQRLLRTAVAQRQLLREEGAGRDELEQARLRIVDSQWALARALIARHLPGVAEGDSVFRPRDGGFAAVACSRRRAAA